MKYCLAVDIGASGGRHIVGWETSDGIHTEEIYRFPNFMDRRGDSLVWDVERLFSEVKEGIRLALLKYPNIESVAIDTWGVDYVLMRGEREVMPVYAYRDKRTDAVLSRVHSLVSEKELYRRTGLQFKSFDSIFQLYCDKISGRLDGVTAFLMLPEYLSYRLTGAWAKERTNATTTGLVSADTLEFDGEIFDRLGLPRALIAPLVNAGHSLGYLSEETAREVGGNLKVILVATHDTASAVEALDMESDAIYISSGTWSILGVKTESALTDEKSRLSGYSNEGGVGYNRYQKNISGMWIIQQLRREICPDTPYSDIADMAKESAYSEIFDVNDKAFLSPDSMKMAIYDYFRLHNMPLPTDNADFFNSAYHSIAYGYKTAIEDLEENVGRSYGSVYIVGGGAKNGYLNSLTESFTKKKIVALPIEATAIGNLKIQLRRREE